MSEKKNTDDEKVKEAGEIEKEAKDFYSWALNRQLTWGVIILTCLTGLIELLPEISTKNLPYLASISIVYFSLSLALSYSIHYLGKLFRVSHEIVHPIFERKKIGEYQMAIRGKHQPYLLKSWITNSVAILAFCIWLITWILKAIG
jgi:hypothetical protein